MKYIMLKVDLQDGLTKLVPIIFPDFTPQTPTAQSLLCTTTFMGWCRGLDTMTRNVDIDLLSAIVLKLGQTNRITQDAFGNLESVTTHSLMLALIARSVISDCYCGRCCRLSISKVLEYCLVHDLHEWKYGDFQSYRPDKDLEIQRANLENAAYAELRESLFLGTWLEKSLFNYHYQEDCESRFVRALDKCLPKLTHKQNNASVLISMKSNKDEFWNNIEIKQRQSIISYAGEFTCVIDLHKKLSAEVIALLPD